MATITTLASFAGQNGQYPFGSLLMDSSGNLFGTTSAGGTMGYGTIFEVPFTAGAYGTGATTLVNFDRTHGSNPVGSLIADAQGNLYGTTNQGGLSASGTTAGYGTVFELAKAGSGYANNVTTLVSFDFGTGASPQGTLAFDQAGNLYGTTAAGGSNISQGVVFEVQKNGAGYNAIPLVLAQLNQTTGYNPRAGVLVAPDGTLYGTASNGGTLSDGTSAHGAIFQITRNGSGASAAAAVNFTGFNGGSPVGDLVADKDGNLFGTTYEGGATATGTGAFGSGTVFEITKTPTGYSSQPITLASFSSNAHPRGGLLIDAAGNLFGTTYAGGLSGNGSVFEIAKTPTGYSSEIRTLYSFDGSNGANPYGSLIADGAGNLFGTTGAGGAGSGGTVFELTNTGFVVVCFCAGTAILVRRDDRDVAVAIETLAIGDLVVTASGAHRPIRWIGRRSYSGKFASRNPDIQPVRFAAGSLGDGVPHRDLSVSPRHAMVFDGLLVPAGALVNGSTITRVERIERVDYFHIELDSHDVLVAEGALAESYVDDDNRGFFHNASDGRRSDAGTGEREARYCLPRVEDGFALEAIRRRLAQRADAMVGPGAAVAHAA